jgi:P-type Cu+ transporter
VLPGTPPRKDSLIRMTTATADARAELTLPVTGMTCASCVRRIEKALSKVEGVQEANVSARRVTATAAAFEAGCQG